VRGARDTCLASNLDVLAPLCTKPDHGLGPDSRGPVRLNADLRTGDNHFHSTQTTELTALLIGFVCWAACASYRQ